MLFSTQNSQESLVGIVDYSELKSIKRAILQYHVFIVEFKVNRVISVYNTDV
jgi:hypothetical protein